VRGDFRFKRCTLGVLSKYSKKKNLTYDKGERFQDKFSNLYHGTCRNLTIQHAKYRKYGIKIQNFP